MLFQIIVFVLLALALVPAIALLLLILMPRAIGAFVARRLRTALDVDAHNATSPYARPGYRPQHTEVHDVALQVIGTLPADLEGLYLRNGTNAQFERSDSRHHVFNGAGMLHQVRIRGGVARYSNCYVRTPRFEAERALGREAFTEFGDLAGGGKAALAKMLLETVLGRAGALPRLARERNSSATTAVQHHDGRIYCLQETGLPFALRVQKSGDRVHLDGTGAFEDFGGRLAGPFSAHPKIDPRNGDWHALNLDFTARVLGYSVLSRGTLGLSRPLEVFDEAPAFLHDAFLTPNYVVFPDSSLRFRPKELMGPQRSPFVFDAARPLRFGLLSRFRPETPVRWIDTGHPGHVWHTVNGWEQSGEDGAAELVLVMPVFRNYPSTVPIHTPLEPHAELMEYRLDPERGVQTGERRLVDGFYERPSINPAWLGRQSRYAWLLDEGAAGGEMGKGVLKLDLATGERAGYFDYGDFVGGEPLFVPSPGASGEDHGHLLDLLMTDERACLVVIDARSMQEVARLPLPQRVPYGVHACWLDQGQIHSLVSSATT